MTNVHLDLLEVIATRIDLHPRSLQKRIGPSEVGTPCDRKLAHRLAQTSDASKRPAAWRPTVGTATHTWLTAAFERDNLNYAPDRPRWVTSLRVPTGYIDGVLIDGELDLYDAYTKTVIDWKVPGPTSIKEKRRAGHPGQEYQIQVQLYGRGLQELGTKPEHVAILFLPSAGELTDSFYWSEPYDEQVALDALLRASAISAAIRAVGPNLIIPVLKTALDHCTHCPWFVPGATDLRRACPGDPKLTAPSAPALTLVPNPTEQ